MHSCYAKSQCNDVQPGAQHKALVEYAPSQRVPKPGTKKDGREGSIYKGIYIVVVYVF